ncbi:MAG: GIN domain-containing protein [Pseudomonadota bacterium]|jgi:hypothetical protein
MIRVLLMITVAGFVLSIAALSAAVAIGGPDAIARGGWHVAGGRIGDHWDWRWDEDDWTDGKGWGGPRETRTVPWSGAGRLDIELAADVRYVQSADGPGVVEITGPARAIEDVVVRGDTIDYGRRHHRHRKLDIVIRAPGISRFDLSGGNTLRIENYRQDRLRLNVSGSGEVTAEGQADEVEVDLSGSAEADLGDLRARGARVDVSGSADAIVAPTDWAELEISGAGDVSLLTNPPRLESDISGAGRVRRVERASPSPSPSPSASPTPSPAPQSPKL